MLLEYFRSRAMPGITLELLRALPCPAARSSISVVFLNSGLTRFVISSPCAVPCADIFKLRFNCSPALRGYPRLQGYRLMSSSGCFGALYFDSAVAAVSQNSSSRRVDHFVAHLVSLCAGEPDAGCSDPAIFVWPYFGAVQSSVPPLPLQLTCRIGLIHGAKQINITRRSLYNPAKLPNRGLLLVPTCYTSSNLYS